MARDRGRHRTRCGRRGRLGIGGDIIPTLTLAIPGSAPAAVLLAAMTIHNLRPGPLLVAEQPEVVGQIIAISMVSTLAVFILSLAWTRQMVKILLIPRYVLMPSVFIICVTGAYALSGRLFDIYVMFAFGLLGVILNELDYPFAPLVLNQKGSIYLTRPSLGHYCANREELEWRASDIFNWLASGAARLHIDKVYRLADAGQAQTDLASRKTTGKLLLVP